MFTVISNEKLIYFNSLYLQFSHFIVHWFDSIVMYSSTDEELNTSAKAADNLVIGRQSISKSTTHNRSLSQSPTHIPRNISYNAIVTPGEASESEEEEEEYEEGVQPQRRLSFSQTFARTRKISEMSN